jgi:hypothetical protein
VPLSGESTAFAAPPRGRATLLSVWWFKVSLCDGPAATSHVLRSVRWDADVPGGNVAGP